MLLFDDIETSLLIEAAGIQMAGFIDNSFLTSPLYRVMLYAAIFPLVYFITMVIGGMRRSFGFSIMGVVLKAFVGWVLIVSIYNHMRIIISIFDGRFRGLY